MADLYRDINLVIFAFILQMKNFKKRWDITSNWQVFIILLVFAITGSFAAILAKPILSFLEISKTSVSIAGYYLCYLILIFPIYQILLVSFGFIFGQFVFFWKFEKKMLKSMKLGFLISFFENKKRNRVSFLKLF